MSTKTVCDGCESDQIVKYNVRLPEKQYDSDMDYDFCLECYGSLLLALDRFWNEVRS